MNLSTFLTFNGNCKEAFEFYKSVFGGEFEVLSTFCESLIEMGAADAARDRVMHVSYPLGGALLMGADATGDLAANFRQGNNISLSISPMSKAEADAIFPKLSDGGDITLPMRSRTGGSYFGMCTDKFGIHWTINVPNTEFRPTPIFD